MVDKPVSHYRLPKDKKLHALIASLVLALFVFALFLLFNVGNKDLSKKGLLKSAIISKNTLIFTLRQGHMYSVTISKEGKTYDEKIIDGDIETVLINNYPSFISEGDIYSFMAYNYEHGGAYFSGVDFCVVDNNVWYGKNLTQCNPNIGKP